VNEINGIDGIIWLISFLQRRYAAGHQPHQQQSQSSLPNGKIELLWLVAAFGCPRERCNKTIVE